MHAIPGADAKVGGNTAVNLDVQRAAATTATSSSRSCSLVVLLILALLLRAILAPLLLVATVVLSFAAALGASALVFKYVFGFAGADTSFPLFVFVFLVALGIDYNIFLMTRVREEAQRQGTRRATLVGARRHRRRDHLGRSGARRHVRGRSATLPLRAFAEIGFAVAFGVLLDTLVVRSVLVTALNLDIGRQIWWPSRLSRDEDVALDELTRRSPRGRRAAVASAWRPLPRSVGGSR